MTSADPLSLIIVSNDWYAASLLAQGAARTDRYQRVAICDDEYTAMVETWQIVIEGDGAKLYVLDVDSVGAHSSTRLIRELYREELAAKAMVCTVSAQEPVGLPGAHLATTCHWNQEQVETLLNEFANRAEAIIPD